MKVIADKIASSTRNVKLQRELTLGQEIVCKEGYVIAVRALGEKSIYNSIELSSGRLSRICRGDVIAGVLGARHALRGYAGAVPESLKPGDTVDILNLGGVFGVCTSDNPEYGPPIKAEVLGAVLQFPSFKERIGKPASIHEGSIRPMDQLRSAPPLIIVTGTCMHAGKTRAACEIIKYLSHAGKNVAAAKLSGISLMRDTLEMYDFGASRVLNFTDVGIVCTSPETVVPAAKGIINSLAAENPDCIVLEFGDGIMGQYGVMSLLLDQELMTHVKAHILSANDPVAAWGALQYLAGKCPAVDVICGPTTDNEVGKGFIEEKLACRAANAVRDPELLGSLIMRKVFDGGGA